MRIVDLSFSIRPHFRWKVAPQLVASHAQGHPLTIGAHAYTHVDAPLHFLVDGRDTAAIPVDQWVGDAAVVDLTHLGANGEVKAVGYDYPPDFCIRDTVAEPRRRPARDEYTTHAILFPAGITVIESLTNLDLIGAPRCRFVALPLKLEGADDSPVRAIALVE